MCSYFNELKKYISISSKGKKTICLSDVITSGINIDDIEIWNFFERNNIVVNEKLSAETESFLIRNAQIDQNQCDDSARTSRSAAISALYVNYEKLLIKLSNNIMKIIDNSSVTVLQFEDVFSESKIAFLKALQTFDESKEGSLCTWIYNVVQNSLLTAVHSRKYDSNPNSKIKRVRISNYIKFKDEYFEKNGVEPTELQIMEELNITKQEIDDLKYELYKGTNYSLDYINEYNPTNELVKTESNVLNNLCYEELINTIDDIWKTYDTRYMTPIKRKAFQRNVEIFYFCFQHNDEKGIINKCAERYDCTNECIRTIYKKMINILQKELTTKGYAY